MNTINETENGYNNEVINKITEIENTNEVINENINKKHTRNNSRNIDNLNETGKEHYNIGSGLILKGGYIEQQKMACQINITNWLEQFDLYIECEQKCDELIGKITEIKNNFHKYLGQQKEDDIYFYKSLIENSHHYVTSCIKVRKLKFIKDLNIIWQQLDNTKKIETLTKPNYQAILNDYKKITDDIIETKRKNTSLLWVKNDKIKSINELENDINEIMEYHVKLIKFTYECIKLKKEFYCGKE